MTKNNQWWGLGAIANQFTPYINYSITETTTEESLIRRRHRELDKVVLLYIDKGLLLQVASFEQYKNDIFATDDIKTEHKNATDSMSLKETLLKTSYNVKTVRAKFSFSEKLGTKSNMLLFKSQTSEETFIFMNENVGGRDFEIKQQTAPDWKLFSLLAERVILL